MAPTFGLEETTRMFRQRGSILG
jgi:hypothetical protein